MTARGAGTEWGSIHGSDYLISGPMQAANPNYYGGERVEMFGGLEYKLAPSGHPGAPRGRGRRAVYQNLNGPQMGKAWQVNAAAAISF